MAAPGSNSSSSPGEASGEMQELLANAFPAYTSATTAALGRPSQVILPGNYAHIFDGWSSIASSSNQSQSTSSIVHHPVLSLTVGQAETATMLPAWTDLVIPESRRQKSSEMNVHKPAYISHQQHVIASNRASPLPAYHPQPTRSGRIPVQPPEEELEAMLAMDNYFEFPSEDDSADEDFIPSETVRNEDETPRWANVAKELGVDFNFEFDGHTSEGGTGLEETGLEWMTTYPNSAVVTSPGGDHASVKGGSLNKDPFKASAKMSTTLEDLSCNWTVAGNSNDLYERAPEPSISNSHQHVQTQGVGSDVYTAGPGPAGAMMSASSAVSKLNAQILQPLTVSSKSRGKRKVMPALPENYGASVDFNEENEIARDFRKRRILRSCRSRRGLRKDNGDEELEYTSRQVPKDDFPNGVNYAREEDYEQENGSRRPLRIASVRPPELLRTTSTSICGIVSANDKRAMTTTTKGRSTETPTRRAAIPLASPSTQAEIRKQRNKEQSKTFRERKKARSEETSDKIEALEAENLELKHEIVYLQRRLKETQKEALVEVETERVGIKGTAQFSLEDLGKVMAVFTKNSLTANLSGSKLEAGDQQLQPRSGSEGTDGSL